MGGSVLGRGGGREGHARVGSTDRPASGAHRRGDRDVPVSLGLLERSGGPRARVSGHAAARGASRDAFRPATRGGSPEREGLKNRCLLVERGRAERCTSRWGGWPSCCPA